MPVDQTERPSADLIVSGASELITCVSRPGDPLGRISGGAVAIAGDRIIDVGPAESVARRVDLAGALAVDAAVGVVAPGFIDCHTHLVFGGSRVEEYAATVSGELDAFRASRSATGILATVEMTRAASLEELTEAASARLGAMFAHGTTTVESKTGYGLTLDHEMKMLEVNGRLSAEQPVDVVSTFLGAHAVPPETTRRRYTDQLVGEMIPRVAEEGLATFCDVYCDEGYFTVEDSRRILQAGLDVGLGAKIHADAYSSSGGCDLAVELGAVSADHLNHTDRQTMIRMAERGVVGVVMPALDFAVAHPRPFDAREMLASGMTLALATDLCPGCWVESQQIVIALAARLYGVPADVALLAATSGAARALALDDRGTLAPGMLADLQVWDVATHQDLVYKVGRNAVTTVIKRGRVHRFARTELQP
jgi:imidazolonepropionase